MRRKTIIILLLFICCKVFCNKPLKIHLWSNNAPNNNHIVQPEKRTGYKIANVTDPVLLVYPAPIPNGLAIVCCPGGGYKNVAVDHEGNDMADWFNKQGITWAVLKYRMPNGYCDVPLSDVQQSFRLLHTMSDSLGISKIGIMGCSAGGHLASTAATHYTPDTRPDFQILLYPVISTDSAIWHRASMENLIGKHITDEYRQYYSSELNVTSDTPPAFIVHCADDQTVMVENSIRYFTALKHHHVPASLHIYPKGGHGWGWRDNFEYKIQWTSELCHWLNIIIL